jgi:multidrug efflux system membrane fusion protein
VAVISDVEGAQRISLTRWQVRFFHRSIRLGIFFYLITAGAILYRESAVAGESIEADALLLPFREAKLGLPVEATLRDILVKEGDFVKRGETLAVLYGDAESLEHQRAEKERELAQFQRKLSDGLHAEAIVSEEQARGRRVGSEVADLSARRARALLDEKTIIAPFDGYVLRVYKERGETVARVEKIIELVNFSTLYAESYLDSKWLGSIRKGDIVQLDIPHLDDRSREATVENVDPVAEPASGLFRVRVVLGNGDLSIPAGVPAKVKFTPETKKDHKQAGGG